MNEVITQYKKIVLLAVVAITMSMNGTTNRECKPCAAAAAAREAAVSIQAAQAALIAAGKSAACEAELDEVPSTDQSRAPREELFDPFIACERPDCGFNVCDLNCKLQTIFNCCVNTNQQVRCQGQEAEKCCKKLRHEIGEVESSVADGFSVIESLILSQADASAACCSAMEAAILDLNLSVAAVLALTLSIFDCTCT